MEDGNNTQTKQSAAVEALLESGKLEVIIVGRDTEIITEKLRSQVREQSPEKGEENNALIPTDHHQAPKPVNPRDILTFLEAAPGTQYKASELRAEFQHTAFDPTKPLENEVHQALVDLRDRGRIHVEEPRFGEPLFSVLKLPSSASELTARHCPRTLAGPEIRRLLQQNGWTIKAFASRWGFTAKHVREVFERGLSDQNSVRDWIEAALTRPREDPAVAEITEQETKVETAGKQRPYSFNEFKELIKRRGRHDSFAEYHSDFERLASSHDSIVAELQSSYKAPKLKIIASNLGEWNARSNSKQENAESIYRKMLSYFLLDGTVSFSMGERYEDAVAKKVRAVTEKSWNAHFAEAAAKRAERDAAIANPQTLLDFRLFIDAKGQDALTNQQMARWDALHADLARERRAQNGPSTVVTQFESEEAHQVGFTVKEGYHTKRECPLWIVQLGTRVERSTFQELKTKAKMLGGWYSSFKRDDAGFQFLSSEAAERFTTLLDGDANREDILADSKVRKEQTAAERLHALAHDMATRAEQTIAGSHESLQNTERRASIQAGVRGRAYADLALSRSLHSVAEALSKGEAEYLDGIRHRTHLETLDTVFHLAKWARIRSIQKKDREGNLDYAFRLDDEQAKPLSEEDIRFAEYPLPELYRRHLEDAIRHCETKKGCKMAATRMRKTLRRTKGEYVQFTHESDINELSDFLSRAKATGHDTSYLEQSTERYNRLKRAGIDDLHVLRAALREYLPHKASVRGDDPVLIAERELIGKDIPGFFPTPRSVVEQMLELAGIQDSDSILEPSCGKGDILDAICEQYPNARLTAVERNRSLADVLSAKGHEVEFSDFLEHQGTYDRILMNPPFEKGADMEHIQHAYSLLSPGGTLVSVVSEGPFFRSDSRAEAFRAWLDDIGATSEPLPENAFKTAEAFRQTGVRTRLLVLSK